jgi:hypothetical protein
MIRMRTAIALSGLCLLAAAGLARAEPPAANLFRDDPVYQTLAAQAAKIKPTPDEVRWQQMPWVIDPAEALRQAKEEKRPIFFWAAGGRGRDGVPLERC